MDNGGRLTDCAAVYIKGGGGWGVKGQKKMERTCRQGQ